MIQHDENLVYACRALPGLDPREERVEVVALTFDRARIVVTNGYEVFDAW